MLNLIMDKGNMKRKVVVSQQNIDEGAPGQPDCCPIALALADMGMRGRLVFPSHADCFDGQSSFTFDMPVEASRFIDDFDNSNLVSPFIFEAEFKKLGNERHGDKNKG